MNEAVQWRLAGRMIGKTTLTGELFRARIERMIETLKANGCRGPFVIRANPDCGILEYEKGTDRPAKPPYTRLARNRWG